MDLFTLIEKLAAEHADGSWGERITAQIRYLYRISQVDGGRWDALLQAAASRLLAAGSIDEALCRETERQLSPMEQRAKSYTQLCCSHSHIDLNFLWAYDETVSIVLNTFETMLGLLEEYPGFIYSQSQAAAYEIVEKYAPHMLEDIKKYVHEGRWEVTASSYVEADKNMPCSASQARQYGIGMQYLSELLDIPLSQMRLDFEPDTFGHSANMPRILNAAGIQYYHFCRGADAPANLFRWRAGTCEVLACKEPQWYDSRIQSDMVLPVPEFCHENHVDWMIKVYGVGDHGGGPTRRDLTRLVEMASWPLFPALRFGSYHEFFEHVSIFRESFPIYEGELQSVFTGCYSSQVDIKQSNHHGEVLLSQAQSLAAMAQAAGTPAPCGPLLLKGWKKLLFNQFHDTVTGSCVPQVKSFALGCAQEVSACANTARSLALRRMAESIDTSCIGRGDAPDDAELFAGGAGSGVFVGTQRRTGLAQQESGRTRVFHLFNPSAFPREEACEVLLWDWQGDTERIELSQPDGTRVPFQVLANEKSEEWGHYYLKLLVYCRVPAFGYCTLVLREGSFWRPETVLHTSNHPLEAENATPCEVYPDIVLENECVRAVLDAHDFTVKSFTDKRDGTVLCGPGGDPSGLFSVVTEDAYNGGGNAWLVGRTMRREAVRTFRLLDVETGESLLRQSVTFEAGFSRSRIKVAISLSKGEPRLVYDISCDWHEHCTFDSEENLATPVRRLDFSVQAAYGCEGFLYDIPMGSIERPGRAQNAAGCSFALAQGARTGARLMLSSADTYGYRCQEDTLTLTLLRATYAPDPYAEQGKHTLRFALCSAGGGADPWRQSEAMRSPVLDVPASMKKEGALPPQGGLMEILSEGVAVHELKLDEASGALILRFSEVQGRGTTMKVALCRPPREVYAADLLDRRIPCEGLETDGAEIRMPLEAGALAALCIKL